MSPAAQRIIFFFCVSCGGVAISCADNAVSAYKPYKPASLRPIQISQPQFPIHFYPNFPKPYTFYQDKEYETNYPDSLYTVSGVFNGRKLPTVTIRNKRNGLRRFNNSKPTIIIDAYKAFNLITDHGLNGGKHDWRTFSQQIAFSFANDMGQDRRYSIKEWFDGIPLKMNPNENTRNDQDFNSQEDYAIASSFSYPSLIL